MRVTSAAFNNGEAVPERYSAYGANMNPPLTIEEVPEGAVGLAVVLEDPDAPNGTFDHWVVWNVPTSLQEIPEGWSSEEVPGVMWGVNGRGESAYLGPKPPAGTHRYVFRVYALDDRLDLGRGASKSELEQAMDGHVLDKAELMGTYTK